MEHVPLRRRMEVFPDGVDEVVRKRAAEGVRVQAVVVVLERDFLRLGMHAHSSGGCLIGPERAARPLPSGQVILGTERDAHGLGLRYLIGSGPKFHEK